MASVVSFVRAQVLFPFCLLIIVSTTLCWGQTITYQETVLAALRHSPQLRMRAEDIRIAEAPYKSSAGLHLYPFKRTGGTIRKSGFEKLTGIDDRQ